MHDIEITEITPLPEWRIVRFKVETEVGQELCCYIRGRKLNADPLYHGDFRDAFEARRDEIQNVVRAEINAFLDQRPDDYTDPGCSHPLKIELVPRELRFA